MFSVVRILVMWLIALAIPVQGMAAVGMSHCSPAPVSNESTSFGHPAGHHVAGSLLAAAADHAMQHGMVAADATMASPDDAASQGAPGHAGHGMLKCCSAACSMAAQMAPGQAAQGRQSEPPPLHPVVQHYRGITPDGLDRPPKSILA